MIHLNDNALKSAKDAIATAHSGNCGQPTDDPIVQLISLQFATAAIRAYLEYATSTELQPIESAPRDGTKVLLCDTLNGKILKVGSAEYSLGADGRFRWYGVEMYAPTHWMPLPDLPNAPSTESNIITQNVSRETYESN